ncbi:MAG TPA: 1,4-alpha-glucan branching protein domain-containing protein, partial [Acidobacteriota bacterium]|nr:1,4-alpha-glucan branching protein domain-containing protein [Acidobacteriota bacterium]
GLAAEGIDFRITMSLTPPLVSMLNDELLRGRYARHLDKLCELAEKEVSRTRHTPAFNEVATMYRERFLREREDYANRWKMDLVGAFVRLQETGKLEIVASAATHGFLPLLRVTPEAVRAQIFAGVQDYVETMGCNPTGIWLPECAFYPGLDDVLKEAGLRYFFVDSHGIHNAGGRTRFGVHAPLYCPSGVAAFGRDPESSKQVWSSIEGYPGDPVYREFYRDIGFDLDFDYIKPYIHRDGIRINTGIKYHRITGRTDAKEPYVRQWALERTATHAANFIFNRQHQMEWLYSWMGRKPIVVAPYDAELFGHWWFEGPEWIDCLIRKIARDQETISMITPSEYLAEYPVNQIEMPSASSWGYEGYGKLWLNGSNDWLYRHLHAAADRMVALAARFRRPTKLTRRALNQAGRELMLAQASDWAFIMTRKTVVGYAVQQTKDHLLRFNRIYQMLQDGTVDEAWLGKTESTDNIFPHFDYRVYLPDYKLQNVNSRTRAEECG